MATTVAVLGGGVGGLSAAHELAERGFSVTVYEKRALPGGKARVVSDARRLPGRARLPVLPGVLPASAGHDGADPVGRRERARPPGRRHADPVRARRRRERAGRAGARARDAARTCACWRSSSSTPRRSSACRPSTSRGCWSGCSRCWPRATSGAWSSGTCRAGGTTCRPTSAREAFRRYLADGLTRTLVAARAKEMSARTGGLILVQLLADLSRAGDRADRVLDAPTSEAWIAPWVTYLRGRGVDVRLGEAVTGLVGPRRADRVGDGRRRDRDRRLLRRRAAGRGDANAALARAARRRAAAERARPARHALDERDPVLSGRGPAAGPRPRHLPRLRVGADLDLPAPVLADVRLSGDRRGPVARHLRVAARGAPDREGRGDVHAGGDPHGGLGAVAGPPRAARWTASRSARGSSTRRSSSRTRPARRTPSRCS